MKKNNSQTTVWMVCVFLAVCMLLVSCQESSFDKGTFLVDFSVSNATNKALSTGVGLGLVGFDELDEQKIHLECLDGSGFCSLPGATEGFVAWPTSTVRLGYGEWRAYGQGFKDDVLCYANEEGLRFFISARGVSVDLGTTWQNSLLIEESYCCGNVSQVKANDSTTIRDEEGSTINLGSGAYVDYQVLWYKAVTSEPGTVASSRTLQDVEDAGYALWTNSSSWTPAVNGTNVLAVLVKTSSPSSIFGATAIKLENLPVGYGYVIGSGEGDYIQFGSYPVNFAEPEEVRPYAVGDVGPAGGYIFYDCDADNETGNADGLVSAEIGWRYLEAAPSDYRTTQTDPAGAINTVGDRQAFTFGVQLDNTGTPLFTNGTSTYRASDCTLAEVGSGQTNTKLLVSNYGDTIYWQQNLSSVKTAFYGARLCDEYSLTVGETVYDDWFLPSAMELRAMYDNLAVNGLGQFNKVYYSSSSENASISRLSIVVDFYSNGDYVSEDKVGLFSIRPVRAFYSNDCVKHVFSEEEVTTATHTTEGLMTYVCENCGYQYEEPIPMIPYAVGDVGPAGGYILYVDDGTYGADDWTYIEIAPKDLTSTLIFGYYVNSNSRSDVVGTVDGIGKGKTNTELCVTCMDKSGKARNSNLVQSTSTDYYAARKCLDYTLGDYDDWYLPSAAELRLVYEKLYKKGIGGFVTSSYWSSTENGLNSAYSCNVSTGTLSSSSSRGSKYVVRPVRYF